jgi:hypothetical protein
MASAYVTVFKPDEPKPTRAQAQRLLRMIRKMNMIVVIPGFRTMAEFSKAFEAELESELLSWQLLETFWWQWLRGLGGSSEVSADELARMMDDTFDRVFYQKRVLYQMLQMPGLEAHSWLVVAMEPIHSGYRLTVVDSNFRGLQYWDYHWGMTYFKYWEGKHFVPYTQAWTLKEERNLRRLGKEFCAGKD